MALRKTSAFRSIVTLASTLIVMLLFQNCAPFRPPLVEKSELTTGQSFGKVIQYQPTTVRRLSNVELINSIQDVFMGGTKLTQTEFEADHTPEEFDNKIKSLGVSDSFMSSLQTVAELASAYVVQNIATIITCDQTPCTPGTVNVAGYINSMGRNAFRRPLTDVEKAEYMALYTAQAADESPDTKAIGAVVEAMILSPNFVYRTEFGIPELADKGIVSLTPFETAAAISYFILRTAPDVPLLNAAAADELKTPAQRLAQVQRLLQKGIAQNSISDVMMQWIGLGSAESLSGKFSQLYPQFTVPLANAALNESRMVFKQEIFSGEGKWKNLFLSSSSIINQGLASIYGVSLPVGSTGFVQVDLTTTERRGVLTRLAFLSSHSNSVAFNPVLFGKFVSTQLFCNEIPAPPADAPPLEPDPLGALDPRERFRKHEVGICKSCHVLMDPLGWAFEQYDPLGRYQTTRIITTPDGDKEIALTGDGAISGTDVNGDYKDAPDMSTKIAKSSTAQMCFTSKLYEYALGRPALDDDALSLVYRDSVTKSGTKFIKSGSDIKGLLGSIAESEAFIKRDAASVKGGVK